MHDESQSLAQYDHGYDSISNSGYASTELMERPPNDEAQPPAEGDGVVKRYDGKHEPDFQKRRDSAGRLERNVGPLVVLAERFLQHNAPCATYLVL